MPTRNARFAIYSLLDKPDLRRIGQRRGQPPFAALQRIERSEPAEREPREPFDVGDARLRRLVPAEHELLLAEVVLLRHGVAGRTEVPGLIMNKRNHLPERTRNPHALAHRI